ncbi:MAG: S8 family serine peptidase, partial [Bryobacterales bacterium]|nr:S8 family serine peptidase [Bryobacterales bacterium]
MRFAVLLLSTIWAAASWAGAANADGSLQPGRIHQAIVEFHQRPTAKDIAAVQKLGGTLRRRLDIVNGAAFTLPGAAVARVAALSAVKYVHADTEVRKTADVTADTATAVVGATAANGYGYTGRGIGIAVVDSGISGHADLTDASGQSRVKYTQSFDSSIPMNDSYGHGTHVAAIIGGSGKASQAAGSTRSFKGIAPDVHFISLAALDRNGNGKESAVIAAIERAITLKGQYNIGVLNLSLGKPVSKRY